MNNTKKLRLPIGISDFQELRTNNCYFADKSLFIKEIIENDNKVLLLPRPRRFGKTLNISMLRYFFENREIEEREKLYHGLKIYNTKSFEDHFGKYPVIFLTFKDVKSPNFSEAYKKIRNIVKYEYSRFDFLLESSELKKHEKKYITQVIEGVLPKEELEESLGNLSAYLRKVYKQQVIILMDEYDTPIHHSYEQGYYDDMISFIRNLMSGAFKDNEHLFKGVITGILRISKESIFTGLNNLGIFTILTSEFSEYFGLTEEEVKTILRLYNASDKYTEVAKWYNGYVFADKIIYNPWSIINYVASKKREFIPYWANTSSNAIIKNLIKESGSGFRDSLEMLLRGEPIVSELNENMVFPQLKSDDVYVYSLLFFSGYLKYTSKIMKQRKIKYTLKIPNEEVLYIYEELICEWIKEANFENKKLNSMLSALVNTDMELFEELFSEFVRDTLSYFDVHKKNEEQVYHAFLLGLLLNLKDEYEVISGKESGYGRLDIMLLHKRDKNRPAVIMELKTMKKYIKEAPEEVLEKALRQIEEKQYEADARKRGYNNICKLGVVFDGKRVRIKQPESTS